MKKRILTIGNSNGLPGVQVDITNYISFFKSELGGGWYDNEIIIMMNPSRERIISKLKEIKDEKNEYVVTIFSGHAGQTRETILELNEKGETIPESALRSLSDRQLLIFDCCRSYPELIQKSESLDFAEKRAALSNIRTSYENRIKQAIPQQVLLYSCSMGETSTDKSDGGIYTVNLLKAARNFGTQYLLVGTTHEKARIDTINETKNSKNKQNPTAELPKCLSNQQLIMSINPNLISLNG